MSVGIPTFLQIHGYEQPTRKQMREERYLVYRKVNGQLTTEIQYGEHTTGEGKKKDTEELERYKIQIKELVSIRLLQLTYPFKGTL